MSRSQAYSAYPRLSDSKTKVGCDVKLDTINDLVVLHCSPPKPLSLLQKECMEFRWVAIHIRKGESNKWVLTHRTGHRARCTVQGRWGWPFATASLCNRDSRCHCMPRSRKPP